MLQRPVRPTGNLLVDTLDQASSEFLLPRMRLVTIHRGTVLATPSRPLRRVLFPTTSIISLADRIGRRRVPVLTVGHEGLVGYWLGLSSEPIEADVICDITGGAWSLPILEFAAAAVRRPEVEALIAEVAHTTAVQLMQNVVCATVHHTLRQRTCRTLLEIGLRLGDQFEMTHEALASVLAATRPSVTREMHELAEHGVVSYERGHVHLLDRESLLRSSCPCVATLANRLEQLTARRDRQAVPVPVPR